MSIRLSFHQVPAQTLVQIGEAEVALRTVGGTLRVLEALRSLKLTFHMLNFRLFHKMLNVNIALVSPRSLCALQLSDLAKAYLSFLESPRHDAVSRILSSCSRASESVVSAIISFHLFK